MTGLQLALALGALLGLGAAGLLYAAVPAQPDLGDVLARLSPADRPRRGAGPAEAARPDTEERLGIWAQRTLPARLLGIPPAQDLAVLAMTPARFYGRKVSYALLGLAMPTALSTFAALLGVHVPLVLPTLAVLVLSVVLFAAPGRDIKASARQARAEHARALSAYIELTALERHRGAGAAAALASAAAVGDSWIFARIGEELARARYDGTPAWDALARIGEQIGMPELGEIGNVMRLAGDENTEVVAQLRAQSAALRSALVSRELAQAAVVEDRMYIPASLLGMVFLALLMAPPLLRLAAGG